MVEKQGNAGSKGDTTSESSGHSPLLEARNEIEEQIRKEKEKTRSEVCGMRTTKEKRIRLQEMAEKAGGLSISALLNLICFSEERPDKILLVAALKEIRARARELGLRGEAGETPTTEEICDFRDEVEELCRGLL